MPARPSHIPVLMLLKLNSRITDLRGILCKVKHVSASLLRLPTFPPEYIHSQVDLIVPRDTNFKPLWTPRDKPSANQPSSSHCCSFSFTKGLVKWVKFTMLCAFNYKAGERERERPRISPSRVIYVSLERRHKSSCGPRKPSLRPCKVPVH